MPGSYVPGVRDPHYTESLIDATKRPQTLNGSNPEILLGTNLISSESSSPPAFQFPVWGAIVKARVVESYEATYQKLEASPDVTTGKYRILKMETEQVLRGKNIPTYFLYLLPSHLYVDMSVYDTLLISMRQIGTENYVIVNKTQNQLEVLSLPLFADYQEQPELGSIIAFTDGIFDESLWQTPSWIYGYQFARIYLDEGGKNLVVSRGCTIEDTLAKITERIGSYNASSKEYTLITLSFTSGEARAALEYVKPFENGVFYQTIENGTHVVFRRYINGCQTEETVKIDLSTETVTYSEVKYTKSDLENIENLSHHILEMASQYENEMPAPPHLDTQNKDLCFFSLYGWYVKVNGKVYGIIKTTWQYTDINNYCYYDDSYTLYMPSIGARIVSRDVLVDIVGPSRYIYSLEYGVGEPPVFE